MPLRKRVEPERSATAPLPGLTHQSSAESIGSPITPAHDETIHPANRDLVINPDAVTFQEPQAKRSQTVDSYPFPTPASAPATTTQFHTGNEDEQPRLLPSKDLAFLKEDPFADDDVIPFDKNKPIIPSRSGSIRSFMSGGSMQSLKRGLGSLKRKLTRRRSERSLRQPREPKPVRQPTMVMGPDGITPIVRSQTYMMGPTFHAPRRVETYQVSAMAF